MSLLLNISLRSQMRNILEFSKVFRKGSALSIFSSKSFSSVKENGDQESIKKYKEIYRFRHILFGYTINKVKWPLTLLTAVVYSTSAAVYFTGILDFDILIPIIISGAFFTGNMYVFGSFFHKAVGFMYLSEDGSTLKISYLDFWGARVNKEVPVDDVMPLADCPRSPTDYFYRTIHFYSTDKLKLKLFLNIGGQVTDGNKFVGVFGDHTNIESK